MTMPLTTQAHLVWGERGTSNVNHPFTPPMAASEWKAARVALELFQSQSALSVTAMYQVSDDGKDFGTSVYTLGSALTADGTNVSSGGTDGFIDLTNLAGKRYVRFGVQVANNSGSNLNTGYAVLRVEGRDF